MNILKLADGRYELTFSHNGAPVIIKAKNIILGMPRRSLELLNYKIALLRRNIDNYEPIVGSPARTP